LTANHNALLEAIALAWYSGEPMSVRKAIGISHLGSPATLHKRLAFLRKNGYLEEIAVEGDRRTKFLGLTEKSQNHFKLLGDAMSLHQTLNTDPKACTDETVLGSSDKPVSFISKTRGGSKK